MAAAARPVLAAAAGAAAAAALAARIEGSEGGPVEPLALADGGPGTLGVLLPALGGETRGARVGPDGRLRSFALVEDGGTALLEPCGAATQELVDAAATTGSMVVVLLATGVDLAPLRAPPGVALVVLGDDDGPAFVLDALELEGRLRSCSRLVLAGASPVEALLAERARALGVPTARAAAA